VAKACESVSQRVQKSIFDCRVNVTQYEELEHTLLTEMDLDQDLLRFYRLTKPVDLHVKEYGQFKTVNFDGPLVI
jgi:CRISPR-associated protein Cas2